VKQLLLLLTVLLLLAPAQAQRRQQGQTPGKVTLQVLDMKISSTASQTDDLVELKVKLTNESENSLAYTNNRFLLKDSNGGSHAVNRFRFPEGATLEPRGSVVLERIYFEIPKKTRPAELSFLWRRSVIGSVKL